MIEQDVSLMESAAQRILEELRNRRVSFVKQIDRLHQDVALVDSEIDRYESIIAQIRGEASLPMVKASGVLESSQPKKDEVWEYRKLSSGTVRDFALSYLESIYPEKSRAKNIQDLYERETGNKLHEKTMGMTLYRLLKDGLATRFGWDWQFVPQKADEAVGASDEIPAAETAGDFNDA